MAGSTVAFLFVDLVGSTELLHRLGDDANDAATRRYMGVLRDAVARRDGIEVKSLGDGLMVAFPGALGDCVACSVDMQRSIARLALQDPLLKLQIRVGVSAGEATCEDGDWSGTPIVEAARLVAKAQPGVILANDVMRVMIGSRGGFEFTPIGSLDLKGFPVPLPSCKIGWEPDPSLPEVPLPAALDIARGSTFIGRESEISQLTGSIEALAGGAAQVVVVTGETGIGKHRLVSEFARRVHADGSAAVLFGRCAADDALPIHAVVQALQWWAASVPPDIVRRVVGTDASRLAALIPSLTARLPELIEAPAVTSAAQRAEALVSMTERIAALAPLLLVLDATGGSDSETVGYVRGVAESERPLLVIVIADCPDALGNGTRAVQVAVGGLDRTSTAALLAASARVPPELLGPDTIDQVHADTGGSPQLVLEAANRLVESGALALFDADARTAAVVAAVGSVSPYKGLLHYEEEDAARFHGRDPEIAGLLARVATTRLVAVIGASGSGKSSLIRAGLLPALRGGGLQGSERWPVIVFDASRRPLVELATRLAAVTGGTVADVLTQMESSPGGLHDVVSTWASDSASDSASGRIVVAVDQFEEIFTLCDDAQERDLFVGNLLHAAAIDDKVIVVLAMRADFFGRCATLPGLAVALESTTVLVGPLDEQGLREVIEAPARDVGLSIDAGLVELIVRDVAGEPGSLPLLSHALYETWLRREHRALTIAGYRSCGGVRGAIAQTAEVVVTGLGPEAEHLAREIFVRLTELGEGSEDTRRRVARAEFHALGPQAGEVLERLVAARLVTTDDETVEIAHEALIRERPRLRGWLDSDRDRLRTLRQLTRAAFDWDARGRDVSDLYRGARLAATIDATEIGHLTETEQSFLDASRAAAQAERRAVEERAVEQVRQNRRLRRRFAGVAVALVVALIAAGFAVVQNGRAADKTRAADFQRLVSQSTGLLPTNRSLGLLLGLEARRVRDGAVSRSALLSTLQRSRGFLGYVPIGANATGGALLDDRTLLSANERARVSFVDLESRQVVAALITLGATPRHPVTMLVADDPSRAPGDPVVVARADTGQIWRIDARSHRPVGAPIESGRPVFSLASSQRLGLIAAGRAGGTTAIWSTDGRTRRNLPAADAVPSAKGIALIPTTDAADRYGADGARMGFADTEALAFSPTGHELAVERAGVVERWNSTTGAAESRWIGSPVGRAPYYGVLSYSPDGRTLVTFDFTQSASRTAVATGLAHQLTALDVPSGAVRWVRPIVDSGTPAVHVVWARDGSTVTTVDQTGDVTNLDAASATPVGSIIRTQLGTPAGLLQTSSGRRLIALGTGQARAGIWSRNAESPLLRTLAVPGVGPAGFSPDGHLLLLGPWEGQPGKFSVWEPRTGRQVRGSLPFVYGVTWGGSHLLGGYLGDGTAGWYDVAAGRLVGRRNRISLEGYAHSAVNRSAQLAVARTDGRIDLYLGTRHGPVPKPRHLHLSGPPEAIYLNAYGSRIAAVLSGGRGLVLDVASGRVLFDRLRHVKQIAFDPTGRKLFVGDESGGLELLDADSGARLGPRFPDTPTAIASIQPTLDGRLAGVAANAGAVRIFDVQTRFQLGDDFPSGGGGNVIPSFAGRSGTSMAIPASSSPDAVPGRTPQSDRIEVWDMRPAEWERAACTLAGRNLTRAEFQTYLPNGGNYHKTCPGWPSGT